MYILLHSNLLQQMQVTNTAFYNSRRRNYWLLKCKETCDISYLHWLNCIIKTVTNATSRYSLRNLVLLNEVLSELSKMSYEDYVHKRIVVNYMLHDFQVQGSFTLNEHTGILQIKKKCKRKKGHSCFKLTNTTTLLRYYSTLDLIS